MAPEGSAVRLDGKLAASELIERLRAEVARLPYVPRLTFVRVGDDPASASYVRSKERLAGRAGVASQSFELPADVSEAELLGLIARLNADDEVDGILVQLPLPPAIDPRRVLDAIDPAKDVDGLHPRNVGLLWSGRDGLVPATPLGVVELLDRYGVGTEGKEAVIVGRSELVGKPLAALLLRRNATVTLAHSRTTDLGAVTRRADILVVAAGSPRLVTPPMVKPGAAVLDVGLTRVDGRIVGDVDPAVASVAGWLTPMPGGTGPMTVVMVIVNTLTAARMRRAA
ncbi:MAG: bifunctional 5,10-methylenetetrahydrofolate dehydrogenase/5,10-methenyltetrahydrofolate cyclohydrolase [Deinococcales bacterium]|nr:bifunctional 5,10-methylenetetrahydrofolate dehydrogenase/5,10-methenyltetrahydrofolate cyclohydrolase [Deinococcales bacterium]